MITPSTSPFGSPLKRFLSAFLLCIAPATYLYAQDATPTTLLPDIDPQDIEIRGEFEVRFPGIMRQPILGFNPRPRVFQIDPNRMPFIETPEQVVASLPISELDRPYPPAYAFMQKPERFRLWSTTGIGNYMSPEADVFVEIPVRQRTRIAGSFHHFSTGSYLPDDDQTTSFRNLDGSLRAIHYAGKRSRWEAGFDLRADRNHLPITAIAQSAPLESLISSPDNNIGAFGFHAGYRNTRNALSHTDVQIGYRAFNASTGAVNGLPLQPGGADNEFSEQIFSGRISNSWTASRPGQVLSLSGGARYGSFELSDETKNTWLVSDLGLAFRTRIGYAVRAEVGARGYVGSDPMKTDQMFLYPELSLQYLLTDRLTLRAAMEGFVRNPGLEGHSQINRKLFSYAIPENERGIMTSVNAEFDVMQGFRVQSGLSYTRYNRIATYGLHPGTTDLLTFTYLNGADVVKWDLSTWFDLIPKQLHAYGGLYVQSVTDRDGDRIAFRENVGVSAGGLYRYTERVRFHAWADYTGSRKVESGRSENGFLLVGAKVDVWASRDIGAYIKITNLLNQSYSRWTGYNELPAQVFGGVMIKL